MTEFKKPPPPPPKAADEPVTVEPALKKQRIQNDEEDDSKYEFDPDTDIATFRSYKRKIKEKVETPQVCPYLDTVNRSVLDFDFEQICSISLSRNNVYMCLVCGRYFQGRGEKTYAFTHSLLTDHHVFLCLKTRKFYCLPDNYEIVDPSLDDVLYVISPKFDKREIKNFSAKFPGAKIYDTRPYECRAQDGTTYLPGIVGLN